jgi:hypothetical protein
MGTFWFGFRLLVFCYTLLSIRDNLLNKWAYPPADDRGQSLIYGFGLKNLPLWEVYRTWDIIAFSHCFWELCPRRALLIWWLKSWEWSKRFRRCQRRSNNQNQYQRGASRCQIESSGIEKLDAQFNINISMIWIDSRLVHDWDSTILMWQGLYIRSIISINEEGTWCALSDNHDGLWGLSPFGRSSRYRESQHVDHRKSRKGIERYYHWRKVALAGIR